MDRLLAVGRNTFFPARAEKFAKTRAPANFDQRLTVRATVVARPLG
jgi:hypothetical protein